MTDGGNVLPQAEIDALFKKATGVEIAHRQAPAPVEIAELPAPPPPPLPPPMVVPPPAVSAQPLVQAKPQAKPQPQQQPQPVRSPVATPVQVQSPRQSVSSGPSEALLMEMKETIDELARRISKVETSLSRLNRKVTDESNSDGQIGDISQTVALLSRNIQKLNARVNGMTKGLENTPAYGIRDDFTCSSCGSHGLVTMLVKCSDCGEEGWWGWWPKEK